MTSGARSRRASSSPRVSDAIANLNASGSWVVLYRVQQVPEYAAVLNQALAEIEDMVGRPVIKDLTWKDSYIFMASPNATTPYHIDHECACLMQVHGDRVAHLWDQKDRSVLSELEIEEYYMGDIGSANYSEKKLDKATVYKMNAGTGVHHPSLAPHAYQKRAGLLRRVRNSPLQKGHRPEGARLAGQRPAAPHGRETRRPRRRQRCDEEERDRHVRQSEPEDEVRSHPLRRHARPRPVLAAETSCAGSRAPHNSSGGLQPPANSASLVPKFHLGTHLSAQFYCSTCACAITAVAPHPA